MKFQKLVKLLKKDSSKLIIAVFLIYFIPRIVSLGWDMANYDARYWYPRMHRFVEAITEGNLEQTYQKYHPGVTLMWTSGFSNHLLETIGNKFLHTEIRYNSLYFPYIHLASKLPLILMISALGALCFHLIRKATNKNFALIFSFMLSLEPFFLGVSRFLHLSALTAMFMFASFLCMYTFLEEYKNNKRKNHYFVLSSVFLGLATLTKIDGGIMGIANAILIASYIKSFPKKRYFGAITKVSQLIFSHALLSMCIFFVLFPAMWVAPVKYITRIIQEGLGDTAFSSSGADSLLHIKEIYYLEAFVFRSLPTSVLLAYSSWIFIFKKWRQKLPKIHTFLKASLIVFAINLAFFVFPDKTKDRYLINFYPYLLLLATYTFYCLLQKADKHTKTVLVGLLTAIYALTLYRYHPTYSFYYSDLLGGQSGVGGLGLKTVQRGEFYPLAALFLNDLQAEEEHYKNVIVLRREQHPSFKWFYLGDSWTNSKFMPDEEDKANFIVTQSDCLDQIPDTCKLIKTFGVKPPLEFTQLWIYDCGESIGNTVKFKN